MVKGIILIITYLLTFVPVPAGHGSAILGFMLFLPLYLIPDFGFMGTIGQLVGWISLIFLFVVSLPNFKEKQQEGIQLIGIVGLYLSLLLLFRFHWSTAVGFSLPFQCAVIISVVLIWRIMLASPQIERVDKENIS
jgi:hypothetical protein